MRPITALTGVALTLALLTGAGTTAATAATAAPTAGATGSSVTKDRAGDHRGKGMIKNSRGADADLRKVRVTYNADQSITATFTVADVRRKRTGPSPTGVQQIVTRKYDLRVTTMESWGPFSITIGYMDPYEGNTSAGSIPHIVGEGTGLDGGFVPCPEGSVKFIEAKDAVQIRVPVSCHKAVLKQGEQLYLSASTESAVKYYDKQLANGRGGGLAGRDQAELSPLTVG